MATEYFDVLIVGAGLSGIGTAYHLQTNCPDKSYAILEARAAMGGTWDLFRYPGIRSDSDMHTLGYNFKPWEEQKAIADGPSILRYIHQTADENNIANKIRYQQRLQSAHWSSERAMWTVELDCGDGQIKQLDCQMLLMCAGYYNYDSPHQPEFPGSETFAGQIIHPQHWPEDVDYSGKRVVVIGSGATAMTLVPSMVEKAAKITMLQRSPTYVISRSDTDVIANTLRKLLPGKWAYNLSRWKNTLMQQFLYFLSRTRPQTLKRHLLKRVRKELGPDYDVATHFTPSYEPWDQRLCLVPNSDLFAALRTGKAEVATDHIASFNERGISLKSGEQLDADIIITATGLSMQNVGGAKFFVDGKAVNFNDSWTYKGLMYSGIPNLVNTFGYINASWTLRSDLTAEYTCRLINEMDAKGSRSVTPTLRPGDANMIARPWIDDFSSGYMQRAMHRFPKQGDREPWINPQNYNRDKKMFRESSLNDGVLIFDDQAPAIAELAAAG